MKTSGPSELGVVMRPGAMIRRPAKPVLSPELPSQTKALTTRIFLRGLNVVAQCGVYAHEKGRTRPLVVDVDVWVVAQARATRDDLNETVDYDTLAAHIRAVASGEHVDLIETFAERVCALILEDTRVERVKLRVEKPGSVTDALCSGVEIERTR
jgi:7,8-dihydroneopterin aldolase/epimerase/oxygenase